jgi:hypothetical protein
VCLLLLQIWGASFYLLNKLFLKISDRLSGESERFCRVFAWSIYITGIPAWVWYLGIKSKWIAAAVELGAAPSMVLGCYVAYRKLEKAPPVATQFTWYTSIFFSVLGVSYSLYVQGLVVPTRWQVEDMILEWGVLLGFLFGVYWHANGKKREGWISFILMNVSMATLTYIQESYIMSVGQLVSLTIVVFGYIDVLYSTNKDGLES